MSDITSGGGPSPGMSNREHDIRASLRTPAESTFETIAPPLPWTAGSDGYLAGNLYETANPRWTAHGR